MLHKQLQVCGYPRSGNNYLTHYLFILYYPKYTFEQISHRVIDIEKSNKMIIPIRNPLDCTASWHNFPSGGTLEQDIKFYLRFHNAVKNNLQKVVLVDFNSFTKDTNYIKNKILENYQIKSNRSVTDAEVKKMMLFRDKEKNLPIDNKDLLDVTKKELIKMPEFQECIDLYLKLKNFA